MRAAFDLTIEGAPPLAVQSFEAFERLHVGGHVHVLARVAPGVDDPLVPDDLIGSKATLEVAPQDALRSEPRRFHGVVEAIELSSRGALVTIVPRLMPLEDGSDHRVFLEKDSVTIAEDLLRAAGLTLDVRVPSRPKPRIQCVQAFEPVLAFVRRILAEDGISLWVEHRESEDVVVFGQDASAFHDLPGGALLRVAHDGGMRTGETVTELRLVHRVTHDGVAVGDYDPDHPTIDQTAKVGGERLQRFVYPGRHRSPGEGEARAQLLLDEEQTEGVLLEARTTCRHVAVGFVVELTDAPRSDQNGRFCILEVRHRGRDFGASGTSDLRYESEIVAVPASRPVRPKRQPAKGLGGLQTMTIMGPSGAEIHTDGGGRVKARFRWDRLSPDDDTASAWIRPVQPPLSGGFFLPRMGWEVLVGFMNDPSPTGDTPIELGRLDNGHAPPAESLPAQKVRSNWGTRSTGGSGKQNQIRIDDAAGNEGMHFAASKNANEKTENDKVVKVTADEENVVGGDHTSTVTLQQVTKVNAAQTYSVGGDRDLTTTGALGIYAASEQVTVGGTRKLTIGGDYEVKTGTMRRSVGAAENVVAIQGVNRHVSGASSVAVGGTWTEVGGLTVSTGVLGMSKLTAGGPLSVSATNVSINASVLSEKYAGVYKAHAGAAFSVGAPVVKLQAGGAFKVKGADVSFKAKTKITLQAGGVTVTITPSSITVKGKLKGDAASVVTTKEEVK